MPDFLATLLSWLRPVLLMRWAVYLAVAAVLWVMLNYSTLQDFIAARERRNHYDQAVSQLQQQQEALQREQRALRTGGFSAEKAIRERLKMIKPGEQVLFIETPAPGELTGEREPGKREPIEHEPIELEPVEP